MKYRGHLRTYAIYLLRWYNNFNCRRYSPRVKFNNANRTTNGWATSNCNLKDTVIDKEMVIGNETLLAFRMQCLKVNAGMQFLNIRHIFAFRISLEQPSIVLIVRSIMWNDILGIIWSKVNFRSLVLNH